MLTARLSHAAVIGTWAFQVTRRPDRHDVPISRPQPQPEYMCDPRAEAQGAALAADAPYWPQHGNPSVLSREFALIANLFIRYTFDDWMFAESAGRPVRAVMHAAAVVASTGPFACTDCEHASPVAVSPWRTVAFRRCHPGVPPPAGRQPEKRALPKQYIGHTKLLDR